jgi:hypothetical protein
VVERVGAEALGFIPDMGIYVPRFPRVIADRFVRDGAQEHVVRHIVEAYDAGAVEPFDGRRGAEYHGTLARDVEQMGGNEKDRALASYVTHWVRSDPRDLRQYVPYVHHVHAKFYEMTDEGEEYSIPYAEIVSILVEEGWSGYLSSEYEGNRHIEDAFDVDSVEQVRRQQELFRRLLAEPRNEG